MAGISSSNEAQIAAMLNLFEYLDYHMGTPGTDLGTLIFEAETYLRNNPSQMSESKENMLAILKEGLENIPGLTDLRLTMSDHGNGIEADAFSCGKDVYVAYRGTGDGKWIDNGRGMTQELTDSQSQASEFFDRVAEACGLDGDSNVIVTGHSKGGNNAQAATLNADNRALIDQCYSFDGQGMSDAAIERYSTMPGYEDQRRKMYGIHGENDYVNELGIQVIPEENTVHIETNMDASDLAAGHALEYLFHQGDGTFGYTLNEETGQGTLGRYADRLSEILMSMPEELRDHVAVSIMQLIEFPEEMKIGYNGDHASFTDMSAFIHVGIPTVIYSLIGTEEGREALWDILTDVVQNYVEEHGVWAAIGTVAATVLLAPVILPAVYFAVQTIGTILTALTLVIDFLAAMEQIGELLKKVGEYLQKCLDAVAEFFEQVSDWVKSKVTGRPIIKSGDFSVNLSVLCRTADELARMQRSLSEAAQEVNRIRRTLPMYGLAASAVKSYLTYTAFRTSQTAGNARSLIRAADHAANSYKSYETRIAENAPAIS